MFAHDLFGKPLHTFPDHALARGTWTAPGRPAHILRSVLRFKNERVRLTAKDGRRGLGKNNPILPAYRYAIRRSWWRSGASEQTQFPGCALPAHAPFDQSGMALSGD